MKRRYWLIGLAGIVAIVVAIGGHVNGLSATDAGVSQIVTQSPSPTVQPTGSTPSLVPPTAPSVTLQPVQILPAPPALPASIAPPSPLAGNYQDPAGQFKVGVLQDARVSPIAGSVLVESKDGNLAYTVVAQSQLAGSPIGLSEGDRVNSLARIATAVFQKGEGFQPGPPQPEAGGGIAMNWAGNLTIEGKTQSVGGVILARPSAQRILLLLVAATEAGAGRVPGAVSALANSLQPL